MFDKIIADKKAELEKIDLISEISRIEKIADDFPERISLKGKIAAEKDVSIIAEIKRQSPSRGILKANMNVPDQAKSYEAGGAVGISVLTESAHFGGSVADLKAAKKSVALPVLRKDFIVHEYQVWESLEIGADAILLIVRTLSSVDLSHFCFLARQLNLEALIEVHSKAELETALEICPSIIGINTRNLETFETDLDLFETLMPNVPYNSLTVCESGITSRTDILKVKEFGADAVLVGENIVRASDPLAKIRELRGEQS